MKLNMVPSSTGLLWVKLGIGTFFKQPLALGGLFFMSIAISQILAIFPVIGMLVALTIVPATTLGMMVATLQAVQGKFPMPVVLASAFKLGRERTLAMLKLGAMYALGFFMVITLAGLLDGGEIAKALGKSGVPTPEIVRMPGFLAALAVGGIGYLLLTLVFWHAPALVHWYAMPPTKALFFSVVACAKNAGAFAIFASAWMAVYLTAIMVLSGISSLLQLGTAGGLMMLPLGLILTTMFICSIYFTFRDCFVHTEPNALQTPHTD